jgi:hypothetical protein
MVTMMASPPPSPLSSSCPFDVVLAARVCSFVAEVVTLVFDPQHQSHQQVTCAQTQESR